MDECKCRTPKWRVFLDVKHILVIRDVVFSDGKCETVGSADAG